MENSNNSFNAEITEPVKEDLTNAARECQASAGMRLFGYLIDVVISFALIFCILYSGVFDFSSFSDNEIEVFGCIVMFIYYAFFEGAFQRTPGKFILGMKVVNLNGDKPSIKEIILRSIFRFIPFDGLSYFWTENNCWHSRWSETVVVSPNDADATTE